MTKVEKARAESGEFVMLKINPIFHRGRRVHLWRGIWVLAWLAVMTACAHVDNRTAESPVYLKPRNYPSREGVMRYLQSKQENTHPNRFCLVERKLPGKQIAHLLMYWQEKNVLLDVPYIRKTDPETEADLIRASRPLDLSVSVVETEDEVNGSTYLVTRAWVDEILTNCERKGVRMEIPAFEPVPDWEE
ncbi:MAG: hypothetical protein LBV45_01625 [Xanthomonadaceae bacterium]|nr:hypothetical protein [Xanthomonadaceae bacterium]